MTESTEQSSLRDYLRIIFKHKILIAVIVAVTVITVNIGLEMRTPKYMASVQMYVKGMKQTEAEYYKGVTSGLLSSHSQLVYSSAVIDRVIKAHKINERPLDFEKPYASKLKKALIEYKFRESMREFDQLAQEEKERALYNTAFGYVKNNLLVFASEESAVFSIRFSDYSPGLAGLIANAISRSYVIFDLEQQILELGLKYGEKNATVLQLQNYIKDFEKSLDGKPLPALEAIGPASVKIIQQAGPGIRVSPKPGDTMARILSLIMSVALGILISFGLDYFDQTIKSPKDIESFLHLKFLGSIPEAKARHKLLMNGTNPGATNYAESLEKLAHKLFMTMKNSQRNGLLISDSDASGETAYVIANLATCMSREAQNNVLIIDAELRKPVIHTILNVEASPGLSEVLAGKAPFETALQNIDSSLYILSAGMIVSNPLNVLGSDAMGELLKKTKEQFDIVLVRCADIRKYTDAVILSSVVDRFMLICNEGKVKRQILNHALDPIKKKNIDIAGAIINNRKYYIPKFIYKIT